MDRNPRKTQRKWKIQAKSKSNQTSIKPNQARSQIKPKSSQTKKPNHAEINRIKPESLREASQTQAKPSQAKPAQKPASPGRPQRGAPLDRRSASVGSLLRQASDFLGAPGAPYGGHRAKGQCHDFSEESLGNLRNSEMDPATKVGFKVRAVEHQDTWMKRREGPRKSLGSDEWLPRKSVGRVTRVTKVIEVLQESWELLGLPKGS